MSVWINSHSFCLRIRIVFAKSRITQHFWGQNKHNSSGKIRRIPIGFSLLRDRSKFTQPLSAWLVKISVRLFGPPSEQVKANSGLVRLQDNYAYIILPFLGFALLWFKGDCFWLVRVSSRWPLSQKLKANDGFVRLRDIHAYCIYIILTVLGLCSSLFWRGLFLKNQMADMAT